MAKPNRGKPAENTKSSIRANAQKLPADRLKFSFEFLQINHPKFAYSKRQGLYFCAVLERIKDLCSWEVDEFLTKRHPALRNHRIDWKKDRLTEASFATGVNGTANPEHDDAAWQFQISTNEHGRVHGFLIGSTFYVVWLDPDHLLYP
jgi:hypothetical protein